MNQHSTGILRSRRAFWAGLWLGLLLNMTAPILDGLLDGWSDGWLRCVKGDRHLLLRAAKDSPANGTSASVFRLMSGS
jgi:hypothetical protein